MKEGKKAISPTGGGAVKACLALTLALGMSPAVPIAMADEGSSPTVASEVSDEAVGTDSGISPQAEIDGDYAATVDGQGFSTLKDAFADVPTDGTETTVTLASNIMMSTSDIATIKAGQNVILDLNGKNITVTDGFTGRPIVNEGTVTVTGEGKIDSSNSENGYGAIYNYGNLHIKSGSFAGNVNANGSCVRNTGSGSVLVIDDGRFSGSTSIIFNEGQATLNGGTYYGQSCSSCNSSAWAYTVINSDSGDGGLPEMTINGGTYSGVQGCISASIGTLIVNDGEFSVAPCDKEGHDPFYALYVAGEDGSVNAIINGGTFQRTGNEPRAVVQVANDNKNGDGGINADASMTIKGGTFTNNNAEHDSIHVENLGSLAVYGGKFIGTVSSKSKTGFVYGGTFEATIDQNFLADGYERKTDGSVSATQAVASIGERTFATLQDAISASNGDTVVLKADVTEDLTVPAGISAVLDLNGHEITNASDHTIVNNGTLTVVDNVGTGVVDNVTHGKAALWNEVGATATLNAGTFVRTKESGSSSTDNGSNSYYAILNHGTMTINDGVYVVQNGNYSSLLENGWQDGSKNKTGAESRLTINGGTFTGGLNTIKNDDYGNITIKGGTFSNTAQAAVLNWNVASIEGGAFESSAWVVLNGKINDTMDKGVLTITGGSFTAGEGYTVLGEMDPGYTAGSISVEGGTFCGEIAQTSGSHPIEGTELSITGGSFSESPATYLDPEYAARVGDLYEVMQRGSLPAGTYVTAEGYPIRSDDLAGGFTLVDNGDGTYTVYRPYVPPAEPTYGSTVSDAEGGNVEVAPEKAKAGANVTITPSPDEGQEVRGVFVTDPDGNSVEVTENADGTYSFEMPKGGAAVTVTFGCDGGELCPSHGFSDVDQSQWYHDAIDWAVEAKVLNGIDGTTLMMPDAEITRAQMAQVLWNVEGNEPAASEAAFSDVDPGEWYVGAISWAVESGVFEGYAGTSLFGPDEPLTREQAALVLQRWSELNGEDVSGRADLSGYPDAELVSDWALDGVSWAVSAGILKGVDQEDGTALLDPAGTATRAQVAALMMRLEGQRTA